MHVKITINGKLYEKDVEPRLLLTHFIRDVAGLTGTHIGCETSIFLISISLSSSEWCSAVSR